MPKHWEGRMFLRAKCRGHIKFVVHGSPIGKSYLSRVAHKCVALYFGFSKLNQMKHLNR